MDTAHIGRMPDSEAERMPVLDGGTWVFPDGRILPLIAGGDDGGDGGGDGGGGDGGGDGGKPDGDGDGVPKTYDESYVKGLRGEAKAHREEKERLAARLREIEDRDKSDDQKRTEAAAVMEKRASEAETRAAALEQQIVRWRVGMGKGLSPELIERLRGESEEEIAADAEALSKLVTPPKPKADDLDGGARKGGQPDPGPGLGRLRHAYSQGGK